MKKTMMMKKITALAATTICGLVLALGVTGCADATGLHNQQSSEVTFVFTNFTTAVDGNYSIPGDYSSPTWNNATTQLTMKDGEGSTTAITLSSSSTTFTLVKTGSWSRAWCTGSCYGNAVDGGTGVYSNFYVDSIPMGTTATVTIDASTVPATITVK